MGGDLLLSYHARWQVHMIGSDVDVIEEIPVHERPVAFRMVAIESEVFV